MDPKLVGLGAAVMALGCRCRMVGTIGTTWIIILLGRKIITSDTVGNWDWVIGLAVKLLILELKILIKMRITGKEGDTGKGDKRPKKVMAPKKNSKMGSKNVEGSRFAILSENMDEDSNADCGQAAASSSKVLNEITNKIPSSQNQLSFNASKYLVSPSIDKNFSRPFKENGNGVWIKRNGKASRKNSQQLASAMDEDIEYNDVL
ncbi:hypothetical protein Dsin_007909 [Dipteronia sinensis]|uniref:Uncharacterized protein n=1 Tax=Dipteronia sinensis TaxID=43782 RepID=A0AAE0B1F2_9ROSI|nr:hypothetical protein Dsin_007909 [Dipteronia sinensis]